MNLGKKTKIVCTIGPATESKERLTFLVKAGMNVMRLNFSHGSFEEHQNRVDNLRAVMKETGKRVAIMQDLSGPKIRIGKFKDSKITLKVGQDFILTTEECEGDENKVFVNYNELPNEVDVGGFIMLQDGSKKLEVTKVEGNNIFTRVIVGGLLGSHRGVNVPGANLSLGLLTDKDKKDIEFGVKNKVDFVALSFVRKADDVRELREILNKAGSWSYIIAKIETPQAVEAIDEIIEVSDGIMIARGDLAIEIPAEEVPLVQKHIIHKCNTLGKPVITATQMMESMINNPVPTRAEISDVANAIIDGTDAIMLSEETTLGNYPIEAVEAMTKISLQIESEVYTRDTIAEYDESHGITDVVSQAAVRVAHNIGATLIVTLTRRGHVPRMIARYRPAEPILALSDTDEKLNTLMLTYGCYPMLVPTFKDTCEIMNTVRSVTLDSELVRSGDKIVIVASMPIGASNDTNFIMVETV